jgi:hypothetical protein
MVGDIMIKLFYPLLVFRRCNMPSRYRRLCVAGIALQAKRNMVLHRKVGLSCTVALWLPNGGRCHRHDADAKGEGTDEQAR